MKKGYRTEAMPVDSHTVNKRDCSQYLAVLKLFLHEMFEIQKLEISWSLPFFLFFPNVGERGMSSA